MVSGPVRRKTLVPTGDQRKIVQSTLWSTVSPIPRRRPQCHPHRDEESSAKAAGAAAYNPGYVACSGLTDPYSPPPKYSCRLRFTGSIDSQTPNVAICRFAEPGISNSTALLHTYSSAVILWRALRNSWFSISHVDIRLSISCTGFSF